MYMYTDTHTHTLGPQMGYHVMDPAFGATYVLGPFGYVMPCFHRRPCLWLQTSSVSRCGLKLCENFHDVRADSLAAVTNTEGPDKLVVSFWHHR